MKPPSINIIGRAIHPRPVEDPPKTAKTKANETAVSEIDPSMERSIDPIMIMKVTPTATMSAGADAMAMRAKFLTEKNVGLSAVKRMIRAISTKSGAHLIKVSRDR
ncbi:hypothetical protein FHW03_004793 [Ochrobactrum sp. RH2CCR150]|nr:hypothetical protein [Ochrobactrum sp. RH2CCR150]